MKQTKVVIGRTAKMSIPIENGRPFLVKIDTGADRSSIWASNLQMSPAGVLSFCLFGPESPNYTGKTHRTKHFGVTVVRSAHGTLQVRYRVQLVVKLAGRTIRGSFTLSDRSKNQYPVLVGCKLLNKKFIVDVAKGYRASTRDELGKFNTEFARNPYQFFKKYHKDNQRGDLAQ